MNHISTLQVAVPINEAKLRTDLTATFNAGVKSLAVVLMHSYIADAHEIRVGEIAKEIGAVLGVRLNYYTVPPAGGYG
jgi:N-methylhydantoinase A/oxoprolinase/acetone carboxylase beta subunit